MLATLNIVIKNNNAKITCHMQKEQLFLTIYTVEHSCLDGCDDCDYIIIITIILIVLSYYVLPEYLIFTLHALEDRICAKIVSEKMTTLGLFILKLL